MFAYLGCRTFASSIYSPGYPEVADEFKVSSTVSLLGLSLYTLGLAFGPALAAPLSETYGRLVIYRVSAPACGIFIVGAGFAKNFTALALVRFFAGFFGSPALSIGGGTIADMWQPSDRGPAACVYVLAPFLGPAVGMIANEN